MALSIFEDSSSVPTKEMVNQALGDLYAGWCTIIDFVLQQHKKAEEVWNYGKSFGWSLRLTDRKRVVVYLAPGDKKFVVSMVFGQKATDEARHADISAVLLRIIDTARVYAEGRGFRIEIEEPELIPDVLKLIAIKLRN